MNDIPLPVIIVAGLVLLLPFIALFVTDVYHIALLLYDAFRKTHKARDFRRKRHKVFKFYLLTGFSNHKGKDGRHGVILPKDGFDSDEAYK